MTKIWPRPAQKPRFGVIESTVLADPFPDIITKSFQECREKRRSLKKKSILTISPTRPHPSTRIPAQGSRNPQPRHTPP